MRTALALAALAALTVCNTAPVKPDFGLKVGNVWTYSQKSGDATSTIKETAVRWVNSDRTHALEIKADYSGGYEGYLYRSQNENGLLSFHNSEMREPGVAWDLPPTVLIKMPFNKGLTWNWVQPFRGQTSGRVTQADLDKLTSYETAVIVSDDEEVTVPAGTYKAFHVQVSARTEARGTSTEDRWYVMGVGLVKSVYADHHVRTERVLTAFTPGK